MLQMTAIIQSEIESFKPYSETAEKLIPRLQKPVEMLEEYFKHFRNP